jgi:hypothetical protein
MTRTSAFTVIAALLLAACSEAPKPAVESKKEVEKPEPISGSSAFFKMYALARTWAPDAEGLHMRSMHLPDVPYEPGKAAAWETVFVSPSAGKLRSYTWSAVEAEGNLHKGVFAGHEESWSGPRSNVKTFSFQALKKDSDEAYKTALEKGKSAADFAKKNPDRKVNFLLEQTNRFPELTWRVLWGESVSTANYSVYISASTGAYLETVH